MANTITSPKTVATELRREYDLPAREADRLVEKHAGLVAKGERFASFAWYVATEIMRAEEGAMHA